MRFLALAFVLTTAFYYCERGTNYYLFPVYPTMFSIGAATCVRLTRWILQLWVGAALTVSGLLLPVVLPILDPPLLQRYMEITCTKPRPFQAASIGAPLTQGFSDELGWRDMEKSVAAAFRELSPEDRVCVAIITANYAKPPHSTSMDARTHCRRRSADTINIGFGGRATTTAPSYCTSAAASIAGRGSAAPSR